MQLKNLFSNIRSFFASPTHSRTLALITVLLLIGATAVTTTVVRYQTNYKQHAAVVGGGGGCATGPIGTSYCCNASQGTLGYKCQGYQNANCTIVPQQISGGPYAECGYTPPASPVQSTCNTTVNCIPTGQCIADNGLQKANNGQTCPVGSVCCIPYVAPTIVSTKQCQSGQDANFQCTDPMTQTCANLKFYGGGPTNCGAGSLCCEKGSIISKFKCDTPGAMQTDNGYKDNIGNQFYCKTNEVCDDKTITPAGLPCVGVDKGKVSACSTSGNSGGFCDKFCNSGSFTFPGEAYICSHVCSWNIGASALYPYDPDKQITKDWCTTIVQTKMAQVALLFLPVNFFTTPESLVLMANFARRLKTDSSLIPVCQNALNQCTAAPAAPPSSNACNDPYAVTQGWGQGSCTSLSSICVEDSSTAPPYFVDGNAICAETLINAQAIQLPFPLPGRCWNYKNPNGTNNNLWNHDTSGTQGSCIAPQSICWDKNNGSLPPADKYQKSKSGCINNPLGSLTFSANNSFTGNCYDYIGPNLCTGGGSSPSTSSPTTPGSTNSVPGTSGGGPGGAPAPTTPPIPQPYLNLAISLPGISNAGNGNNNSPKHNFRAVHVQVYNQNDDPVHATPVIDSNITLTYNTGDGNFENSHAGLGKTLTSSGQFQIFIKTSQTLRKKIGANIPLINDNTAIISPAIPLLSGDYLSTNILNGTIGSGTTDSILQYNAGVSSCYGSTTNTVTSTCTISLTQADLNDDGVVDGIDYNIFLRSLNSFANPANAVGDGASGQ